MFLFVNAAGCVNACHHCSADGKPPYGVLYSLKELREIVQVWGFVCPYYEVTVHPEFPDILAPEIVGNKTRGVLHTTGAGLGKRDDAVVMLKRLRTFGYTALSFTLHGLESHHDWFVGREGAFQTIIAASRQVVTAGLGLHWKVYLDRLNLFEIPALLARGREEFGVTAWLDIPIHRVSARLWRYEMLRPDLHGVQQLLANLDVTLWGGPLKDRALETLTEDAWLAAWRQHPDAPAFRHPFEPRAWPPISDPGDLVGHLMPRDQLFLEPLCSTRIPLGPLPATHEELYNRLRVVNAPLHTAMHPTDARLPQCGLTLLHTQGFSVRYKAISAAVFGDKCASGPRD